MVGFGQSMTPILKSGQPVICKPVTEDTELKKNDIVLCKVCLLYTSQWIECW